MFDAPMDDAVAAWHNGKEVQKMDCSADFVKEYRVGYILACRTDFNPTLYIPTFNIPRQYGFEDAIQDREGKV